MTVRQDRKAGVPSMLLLLTLLAAAPLPGAMAADYYVATNGSGSTCSQQSPCASIQAVIDSKVLRNDTIHVAAGTYYGGFSIGSADSGTGVTTPVTIRGAGKDTTFIYGLSTPLVDDAAAERCTAALNCAGDGVEYALTYRLNVGSRSIRSGQVWETAWYPTKVRASDDTTEASYYFNKPVALTPVASVATVNRVAGSYYYAAPNLYVRSYDGVAPSLADTNLETGNLQTLVNINATDFLTIRDLTLSYADRLVYVNGDTDHFSLINVNLHSGREYGIVFYGTADNATLTDVHIDSIQERHGLSSAGKNDAWGIGDNTNGNCAAIANSGTTVTGHRWTNLDARSCWNGLGFENIQSSTFDRIFAEGSTNHVFRITPGGPSDCSGVVFQHSVFINGQDALYNAGCRNVKYIRNVIGAVSILNQGSPPSGLKFYSNVTSEDCLGPGSACDSSIVNVPPDSTGGFGSDYNWYSNWADECNWAGTNYNCRDDGVGTDWPDACNCDSHQVTTNTLTFAGTTWSLALGLPMDGLTREDFYPVAGSPLIDAGNPDLDGDGVLEAGPGGDDECTAAHHCYGGRPDIGPFEYGLDTPSQGGGAAPDAPSNVRRTDK